MKSSFRFIFFLSKIIIFFGSMSFLASARGGSCSGKLVCSMPAMNGCQAITKAHDRVLDTFLTWKDLFQSATTSIDIDMAYIHDPENRSPKIAELINILKVKAQSGVKVRVFLDSIISSKSGYGGLENIPKHPNISVALTSEGLNSNVNHKKMLVIDGGKMAYIGSANFDANLFDGNVGDCGFVFDGFPAHTAAQVFNVYFNQGKTEDFEQSSSNQSSVDSCKEIKMVCSHFPNVRHKSTPSTLETLTALIEGASRSIDLQMYYMNFDINPPDPSLLENASNSAVVLSKVLNAKCQTSVEINVTLDSDSFHKTGIDDEKTQLEFLRKMSKFMPNCMGSRNFHLKVVHVPHSASATYAPQVHSKYMIVDGKTAWIGSENWPDAQYFDGNSNCGVVITSQEEVEKLHQIFAAYQNCHHTKMVNTQPDNSISQIQDSISCRKSWFEQVCSSCQSWIDWMLETFKNKPSNR